MKKLILSISSIALTFSVQAQLVPEHNYFELFSASPIKLDNSYYYVGVDTTTLDVLFFTENHAFWKTIPSGVPHNANWRGNAFYASRQLFDNDNDIEIVLSYRTSISPVTYVSRIVNEDGSDMATLPNVSSCYVTKVGAGWKLLANYIGNGVSRTDVYGLPGQYLGMKEPGNELNETSVAPNPFHTSAKISYQLPEGERTGTIEVFNSLGQRVRSYRVTDHFRDVLISRGELPAGTYMYQVTAGGKQHGNGKMVIE